MTDSKTNTQDLSSTPAPTDTTPVETTPVETTLTSPAAPVETIPQQPEKNNKYIILLLLLILIALITAIGLILYSNYNQVLAPGISPTPTSETPGVTPTLAATILPSVTATVAPTVVNETMTLKFYVSDSTKDPDMINCDAPSYVERQLPKSSMPLTDGINYLLHSLKLTAAEKTAGLINSFEDAAYVDKLAGFQLKSATVVNKLATLTFEDPSGYTSVGSCRSGVLASQITGTAKQFPTVTDVKFLPEDTLFQP